MIPDQGYLSLSPRGLVAMSEDIFGYLTLAGWEGGGFTTGI